MYLGHPGSTKSPCFTIKDNMYKVRHVTYTIKDNMYKVRHVQGQICDLYNKR